MADLIECSPSAISSYIPCINCATQKQLWSSIAVLLCKVISQNGGRATTSCDPALLLSEYKCYQCMNDEQMMQAVVKLIVNWLLVNVQGESNMNILHDIACMDCLPLHQIKSIIMGELCEGITEGKILCGLPV